LHKILFILGMAGLLFLFSGCLDFDTPTDYVVEGEWEAETETSYRTIWISFEEVEGWSNTGEIHFPEAEREYSLSKWEWDSLNEELTGRFVYKTENLSQTWEFTGEFQNRDELYMRFYSSSGLMVNGIFHRQ